MIVNATGSVTERDGAILTGKDVQAAVAWLKGRVVPAEISDTGETYWYAYIHPNVEYDFMGDSEAFSALQYNVPRDEQGKANLEKNWRPVIYGVKFFRTMANKVTPPTATDYVVYSNSTVGNPGQGYFTFFCGADNKWSEEDQDHQVPSSKLENAFEMYAEAMDALVQIRKITKKALRA